MESDEQNNYRFCTMRARVFHNSPIFTPPSIHAFDTVSRQFVWVGETKYLAEGATRRADRDVVLEGYLQVANSGGFIE